ncbi:DNA binding protein [Orbilia brochopaga]|uniref:DNA binding protein n=1 Tax=Orbilia brochopaga TaxID=3140254 RepID=A0AAV9U033_9PEZI
MPVRQLQRLRSQQAVITTTASLDQEQQTVAQSLRPSCNSVVTGIQLKTSEELLQQQAILLKEQQSQKLVQELIGAAIGCITYLRGLIPENSFCDMVYGSKPDDIQQSQDGREPFSQESITDLAKKEYRTRIKGIQRGFSSEADTLLDWMEQGIFCALNKGYLRAFQLAIFLDLDNPQLIQEAYTFSIQYHHGEYGKAAQIEGIAMTTVIQNGKACPFVPELLDITHVRRSVKALIRRLIVITQNLDLLPEKRYLTIRLYHTSDTPKAWTPPMFTPSSGKPLCFDQQNSDGINDEVFGTMDTGLHSVQIRVTAKKRPFEDTQGDSLELGQRIDVSKKRRQADDMVQAADYIPFAIDSISPQMLAEDNHNIICSHQSRPIAPADVNADPQELDSMVSMSQEYIAKVPGARDERDLDDLGAMSMPRLSAKIPSHQTKIPEHESIPLRTHSLRIQSPSISSSSEIVLSLRSLGDRRSNSGFPVTPDEQEPGSKMSPIDINISQDSISSSQGIGETCSAVSKLQLNTDKPDKLGKPLNQQGSSTGDDEDFPIRCECGSMVSGLDEVSIID